MFQTEIYTFRIFILAYVAFSSCLRREDRFVVVFFFHEEHEDMPLSWWMILFRIFRVFGSEGSIWSEITNPILDSLEKTHLIECPKVRFAQWKIKILHSLHNLRARKKKDNRCPDHCCFNAYCKADTFHTITSLWVVFNLSTLFTQTKRG